MIGAVAPAPGHTLSSAPHREPAESAGGVGRVASSEIQPDGKPTQRGAWDAPITPSRRMAVVDRSKVDPRLREAAEGMEAMFLNYLMKTMRQTIQKNDFDLENGATEIYRSMMDTETAQKAARSQGVGLADQVIAYLQSERYNQDQGHGVPSSQSGRASTGGTYESQFRDPVRQSGRSEQRSPGREEVR